MFYVLFNWCVVNIKFVKCDVGVFVVGCYFFLFFYFGDVCFVNRFLRVCYGCVVCYILDFDKRDGN